MASTTLVKDVIWRAAVLLQDHAPQFQRWSEHELIDWLNDGQMAIAKFIPIAASRIDAVKLVAGTRQSIDTIPSARLIPGNGSAAATTYGTSVLDIVRDMGVDGATPGAVIRRTQRQILDAVSPLWHTKTAPVCSSWMYDPVMPTYFYVTPGLKADRWVEISYTAQPARVAFGADGAELYGYAGSNTTKISIGDEYVDDLVNYIAARANMADAETADNSKAGMFTSAFLASLNASVAAKTGTNPNLKQLPFAPAPIARAAQ